MGKGGWSDEENEEIVADYFAMLEAELAGAPYSKASHNRDLQERIARGRGSIEYKHQNISAVLKGMGETWIEGYKPAFNYQSSLMEAVHAYLEERPDVVLGLQAPGAVAGEDIEFGPAPTMRNAPPPDEAEQMMAVARHYDIARRQEMNRILGEAGEARVIKFEKAHLVRAGRDDLAEKVRWVSKEDGDGAGYDVESYDDKGRKRLIEVKTTNGWERTPFHISHNELEVAERRPEEWCLVRLWNFNRGPKGFEIRPPLESHVSLMPTAYRAEFISAG